MSLTHPDRLKSMSILSIPHPGVVTLRPYVKLLSIPWLPGFLLRARSGALAWKLLPEGRMAAQDAEYRAL